MKKIIVLILFLSLANFAVSQESKKEKCNVQPFNVYLDDDGAYSNIRETPKGNIVLKINNVGSNGYVLKVIDVKEGWFKINHISGVDGYEISDFEGWVHHSIVGAAITHDVDILDKPNGTKKVGKLKGEVDTIKIKDIYCDWIKVECKGVVGWVESKRICGNPVTTCP